LIHPYCARTSALLTTTFFGWKWSSYLFVKPSVEGIPPKLATAQIYFDN
jgi:hypothetical protein